MGAIIILAVIVAGYQAVQHYNAVSRYNYQYGKETPFFSFMLKNHPFVTIGAVLAFGLLLAMGFN